MTDTPETPETEPHRKHLGALAILTRACAHHPWRTIGAWVVAVIVIFGASATIGGKLVNDFSIPNSDAQRATDLLKSRFPTQSGDNAQLIFQAPDGLKSPQSKAAVQKALAAAGEIPGVTSVDNPFKPQSGQISRDGTIGYSYVQFREQAFDVPQENVTKLKDNVNSALEGSDVQVAYSGAVITAIQPNDSLSTILGLIAAVIVLVIVFGTIVAAGVPLIIALISLGLGLSLLTLAAALTHFNTITPVLATMIGLGVGIDYSLFIVTRFRQALHDGASPEDAAALAGATAGRAVVFAGTTVAISICSLAVIGLDFVTKLGFGGAIAVLTTVCTAITLLPAILRLLGHKIDRWKVPGIKARNESAAGREHTAMARWGRFVTSHAKAMTAAALVLLLVMIAPVFTVHLGSSDAGSGPKDSTARQAYDLLAKGFGAGFNGPLVVVVDTKGDPSVDTKLETAFKATPGVASVTPPLTNPQGNTSRILVFPSTSPQSQATSDLVHHLRDTVVPASIGDSGARAYVGGETAAFDDIAEHIFSKLPLFLLVVLGITFLVLAMAFRSIVIAFKAAIATLLSSLAAFGVLVLVFQHGVGLPLIGLDRTGPIESFLPVIVFAILFGLSMDYEVFLVSRIREEYTHGDTPREAIRHGMSAIGRVIVAAATIMATVFFAFLIGDDRTIKEFGIALGVAIITDAFVVRLTLVPAVMHLLNYAAWYMPKWLDKLLPRITIEPPPDVEAAADEATRRGAGPALGEA
jgi:RND superfamily putative drug exporter